jgi:type 1 fimbriae regulatory protein FimB/type 1 fimbriae regulatory protein FimE
MVRLFRVQRRALLWTAIRHPLLRWRAICVPPMLWLGLRKQTADGAASGLGAGAEEWMGHKNIQHTVRYTELAPHRFKNFWRD